LFSSVGAVEVNNVHKKTAILYWSKSIRIAVCVLLTTNATNENAYMIVMFQKGKNLRGMG